MQDITQFMVNTPIATILYVGNTTKMYTCTIHLFSFLSSLSSSPTMAGREAYHEGGVVTQGEKPCAQTIQDVYHACKRTEEGEEGRERRRGRGGEGEEGEGEGNSKEVRWCRLIQLEPMRLEP